MNLFEQRLVLIDRLIELQKIEPIYDKEVRLVLDKLLIDAQVNEVQANDIVAFFENPEWYVGNPEFGGWTSKEIKDLLIAANKTRITKSFGP